MSGIPDFKRRPIEVSDLMTCQVVLFVLLHRYQIERFIVPLYTAVAAVALHFALHWLLIWLSLSVPFPRLPPHLLTQLHYSLL